MNLDKLKGKKVFNTNIQIHNGSIDNVDITFEDGTMLHFNSTLHYNMHISHTKKLTFASTKLRDCWDIHDIDFQATLNEYELSEYKYVRKAFFWLINNPDQIKKYYQEYKGIDIALHIANEEYLNKNPHCVATIFFILGADAKPDFCYHLGEKKHWNFIQDMYKEILNLNSGE